MLASPRSWPCLVFTEIIETKTAKLNVRLYDYHDLWGLAPGLAKYARFVYTKDLNRDTLCSDAPQWLSLFAEIVEDPVFYNLSMHCYVNGIGPGLRPAEERQILKVLLSISRGQTRTAEEAYKDNRYFQFLVDKIVWGLDIHPNGADHPNIPRRRYS